MRAKRRIVVAAVLTSLSGCAGGPPKKPRDPKTASVSLLAVPPQQALAADLVADAGRSQPALETRVNDPLALARALVLPSKGLQDARFDRDEAKRAYKQLAFRRALARLDRAQKALLAIDLDNEGTALLADVALWRGLNLLALGRQAPATQAVRWALDLGYAPRRGDHAPEVESFIEGVQKSPRDSGSLTINTEPAAAQVWVDGRPSEVTPTTLQLPSGLHLIRVEATGYNPRSLLQLIQPNRVDSLAFALQQAERPRVATQLLSRKPASLRSIDPGIWRRLFDSDGLVAVDRRASDDLAAHVTWLPSKGSLACQGSRRVVVDCLGSGLYRLSTGREPPPPALKPRPLYKRWWFWAIIGSAVAGAAGVTIYAVTREDPSGIDVDIVTAR